MKAMAAFLILIAAATCGASATPQRKETLEQHLRKTEQQVAKMAQGNDKVLAKMKQIEDQLDSLIAAIRGFREKLESKG